MRHAYRLFCSLLCTAALLGAVAITGCAARGSYRVYDPYYNDYHNWDHHEDAYYHRWETEHHKDHRDFDKRDKDEQKDYWNWRHNHQ